MLASAVDAYYYHTMANRFGGRLAFSIANRFADRFAEQLPITFVLRIADRFAETGDRAGLNCHDSQPRNVYPGEVNYALFILFGLPTT